MRRGRGISSESGPARWPRHSIHCWVERRSQLFLTDGVRASIRTIVTEAQHIQGSIVFGHRRETRHVSWSLVAVKGVEQSAVQHRLKPAPQTLQLERVSRSKLNLDPTVVGLLSGDRQSCLRHVNAQNRQPQRGDVKLRINSCANRSNARGQCESSPISNGYSQVLLKIGPRNNSGGDPENLPR